MFDSSPEEILAKLLSRGVRTPGPLETDCLIWQGATTTDGYPRVGLFGRHERVHRLVLEFTLDKELSPKQEACHRCDNPTCIEPTHLFEGDHQGNMHEAAVKGRSAKSNLNPDKIRELRTLHSKGWSKQRLADRYEVSHTTIYDIIKGKTWTHVK